MKKNLFFLFGLILLGMSNLFSQEINNQLDTVDLMISDGKGFDATTASIDPFTTYDFEEKIQAYAWTQGGILNVTRAFIQFDMSSIPSGSTIFKAYLILHDTPIMTHSGVNDCYVKRVTSSWNGNSLNDANQPSVTNVDLVYIPETITQSVFTIDVTNITQYIISNPTENYGYRISLVDETPLRRMCFSSSECTDVTKRPMLKIIILNSNSVQDSNLPQISISPNPVANSLKIEGFQDGDQISVQIFSTLGQLVYSNPQFDPSQTLDVSNIENGFYFMKMVQNGQSITKKVLIQK